MGSTPTVEGLLGDGGWGSCLQQIVLLFSSCFYNQLGFFYADSLHMFFNWFLAPDVDECKEKLACQCPECSCKNTWGSYECSCSYGLLYMQEHDICISKYPQSPLFCLFDEIHTVGQFHLMFTTHWFVSCEFAYTNRGRKFLVVFILKWSFMLICLHWLALHGCWIWHSSDIPAKVSVISLSVWWFDCPMIIEHSITKVSLIQFAICFILLTYLLEKFR